MAVILTGSDAMFDAMIFGTGNSSGGEYVAQLNQAFINNVAAPVLVAYYQMQQHTMFQSYREDALRSLKAIGRGVETMYQTNGVSELYTIGQLQHANAVMQRWIMACPEVRTLYHQQRIDGYSDTYTDLNPGVVGLDHYEYRRVTNGMTMQHGDDELTFDEQIDIMYTWNRASAVLHAAVDDPTSKWNQPM